MTNTESRVFKAALLITTSLTPPSVIVERLRRAAIQLGGAQ
jgi:hypothetical protein